MTAAELTIYLWAATVGLLPLLIIVALLINLVKANLLRQEAAAAANPHAYLASIESKRGRGK